MMQGEGQVRWQKSNQMSTAGGNTTLTHRVNGRLCGEVSRSRAEGAWAFGTGGGRTFNLCKERERNYLGLCRHV